MRETGLPLGKVRKICRSQFLIGVAGNMKRGDFPKIRLQYLGTFFPLEPRIKKHNRVRKYESDRDIHRGSELLGE